MLQKLPNFFLALLSGLLFSAGWFSPFTFLIFFAWIPLLTIEHKISIDVRAKNQKLQLILFSYLSFFIWNICVTWWVSFASVGGACLAFIGNSAFMCTTFMIWHNLKKRLQKPWAIWLLIPIWLGYEYGHTLWDLTWSWLIMGNAFAFQHQWIQWYEYTGASGGSLWILIVNILCFQSIQSGHYSLQKMVKPILAILAPLFFSLILYWFTSQKTAAQKNESYKTVVIQPNIDPYNDKFYFEPEVHLQNLLKQVKGQLDSTVDFLVLPETYLTENIFEGKEQHAYSLNLLHDSLLKPYPNLTIISGACTIHRYAPSEEKSSTAQKHEPSGDYFDSFNTGMQFNQEGISYYHKSKLVPGVERMPFPALLKPLERFAIDLGGTMGSLGTQPERTVFFSHQHKVGIAPVICYESVYSDYVSDYIDNGANLIFILTNDGWWENTPGHQQHLAYAKLRAIESRREIARCANTGISCFITPYGDIEQATPYWEQAVITKNMTPTNTKTFFTKFGDLISYSSSAIAILLLIWSQFLRFKKS